MGVELPMANKPDRLRSTGSILEARDVRPSKYPVAQDQIVAARRIRRSPSLRMTQLVQREPVCLVAISATVFRVALPPAGRGAADV